MEWGNINEIPEGIIVLPFTVNKEGEKNPIFDRKKKPIQLEILPGRILRLKHSDGETKTRIDNYSNLQGVKRLTFVPLQT